MCGVQVETNSCARNCLLPMGVTSENVAARFGVTRKQQDATAVKSHKKAAAATASGRFKDEIVPVHTKLVDPKTGDEKAVLISHDDGFRPDISLEALAKLRPVFKKDGSTTAGNSSQVSDGAAAVLLMRRSEALKRGVPVLGVFRSFVAVGVDPSVMGIGPAVAIPAAVKAAGLELSDIDLFEINEVRMNASGWGWDGMEWDGTVWYGAPHCVSHLPPSHHFVCSGLCLSVQLLCTEAGAGRGEDQREWRCSGHWTPPGSHR